MGAFGGKEAMIYDTTKRAYHTTLPVYSYADDLNSIGVYHLSIGLPRLLHDS